MNIQAVKAYSQAAGNRPSLPVRRREAMTDAFDIQAPEKTEKKQQQGSTALQTTLPQTGIATQRFVMKAYEQDSVKKESFEVFTKHGQLHKEQYTKGTLFDGRA